MDKKNIRTAALVLFDIITVNVAVILSLLIRYEFNTQNIYFQNFFGIYLHNAFVLTAICIVINGICRLYTSLWEYVSLKEQMNCIYASVGGMAINAFYLLLKNRNLPKSVYIITALLMIVGYIGIRFSYRIIRESRLPGLFNLVPEGMAKVMLIGCGNAGANIIKNFETNEDINKKIIVGIDDDPEKIGQRINGLKILGNRNDIVELADKYDIDEIVIAIPTASKLEIKEILAICQETSCKVQILPTIGDLVNGKVSIQALRDVQIEDLLGREPVKLSNQNIEGYINNQVVMVTGGGGSIGSELVRQIAIFAPRKIVAVDIYENSVFDLQQGMKEKFPAVKFEVKIGSVADKVRLDEIFKEVSPSVVFHAAAHKHVPLMEDNPREAILNNVLGTNNTMDLAEKYGARKFVLISTDKAVNPTSVMGATKRICEMLMQQHASESKTTQFVAVRFGNVLGSNGSVIPTFKKQIAAGGPVTVTHKEITRFFMTIPEAVQLVLQAGSMAKGGEIFVLDMGEPVKILDLAENLIRLSGMEPYIDIDIQFTGLRPGEKLYEELLLSEEGIKDTAHGKIFIGNPVPASEGLKSLLENDLEKEIARLAFKSENEIRQWIKDLVPNFLGGAIN